MCRRLSPYVFSARDSWQKMDCEPAQQLKTALDHVVLLEIEVHDHLIGQKEGEPQPERHDERDIHPSQPALSLAHGVLSAIAKTTVESNDHAMMPTNIETTIQAGTPKGAIVSRRN